MQHEESGSVVQFLRRDSRLVADGGPQRADGKSQTANRTGGDAPSAANHKHIQGGYLTSAILDYVPADLEECIASINKTLKLLEPYASNDVNDWVVVSGSGHAKSADDIIQAAIDQFGGCPARAVYRRMGIEIDPNRIIVKPSHIDEWCVVQLFKNVSHHKLSLVFQISSAYWPERRLHQIISRPDFEANAAMFECGEDLHFLALEREKGGAVDDATAEIFARLKTNYLANYERFNGLTRYSTAHDADVTDHVAEWSGAD